MSAATEHTYTLADLEYWPNEIPDWPSDGTALAVLGCPIEHSLSPAMHNAALAELAAKCDSRFENWRYYKFRIEPEELPAALTKFRQQKFLGLNLTVPHKVLALQHINLQVQQDFVREMGAANTLKNINDEWYGYNTDGPGLVEALRFEFPSLNLQDANIIILGAGGASRAAAVMCLGKCASLQIGSRSAKARGELINFLQTHTVPRHHNSEVIVEGFDLAHPSSDLREGSIIINATSLGLKPGDGSPLDLSKISTPAFVYDMIYNPPQTALLKQAADSKIPHANGLSMLVFQGASALKHWTGQQPPISVMMAAARAALANSH